MRTIAMAALLVSGFISSAIAPLAPENRPAPRYAELPTADILPIGEFSVLTYNVKGLPWPTATGRPRALAEIGNALADMRANGTAPQIVVLQEAFTAEARAIAVRAGYPYVVYGPGADDPPTASKRHSGGQRSFWKGETLGPLMSSGLVLMSEYPLHDIRRATYGADACAGYDCLANKGAVSARFDVPGIAVPVEIITTHTNSNPASGRPEPVNRLAYARQLQALGQFAVGNAADPAIRIYAGDFNVGHTPPRLALLQDFITRHHAKAGSAQGRSQYSSACASDPAACRSGLAIPANVPLVHANDWQFTSDPEGLAIIPVARDTMFGPDEHGRQLSDHLGLKITYRIR